MKTTTTTAATLTINDVQTLKSQLVRYIGMDRWNNNSMMDMKEDCMTLVSQVMHNATGFAKDVATTVDKYEKISEKQAYIIAKAACELGLPHLTHGSLRISASRLGLRIELFLYACNLFANLSQLTNTVLSERVT